MADPNQQLPQAPDVAARRREARQRSRERLRARKDAEIAGLSTGYAAEFSAAHSRRAAEERTAGDAVGPTLAAAADPWPDSDDD